MVFLPFCDISEISSRLYAEESRNDYILFLFLMFITRLQPMLRLEISETLLPLPLYTLRVWTGKKIYFQQML
jgi:hypothetical protein